MADDGPSTASGARVLVVDDTEANRDLLVRRLERQGHQSATAENGRVALEMLRQEAFDLVLLDVMMPEMNGFELLEHLKADAVLKHVPVILISALDDTENMAKGIAMGADDFLPKPFNKDILKARIGASLARKRLHDTEQKYAQALEREMAIGHNIQAEFLPDHLPVIDGLELDAWFEPARHVAGDFYDTFELASSSGRHIALVIADVCGKGVGAALFMAVCRSLLRILSGHIRVDDGDVGAQVRQVVKTVNDYNARMHGHANMFATLFFGVLDAATGRLVYVNGGHDPPLITGAQGVRTELMPTGPAVGMLEELDFTMQSATLAPGEALVLSTDGVSDATDRHGAFFSRQRLLELVASPAPSAQAMVARIRDAVRTHAQDAAQFDDITLLVARRPE